MIGDVLVNKEQYGFIHIKSREVRAGYTNIKDMVEDMIELYKLLSNNNVEYYKILDEFCVAVPLSLITEVKVLLGSKLLRQKEE